MEQDKSVAEIAIAMESGSGDKIVSKPRNTKTHMPISMYFEETTTGQVRFKGKYMEVYIPQEELDRKNTIISGREVFTFGIFLIKIWDEIPESTELVKPVHTTRYMYPSKITTIPSMIVKKSVSLRGEEQPCLVLGYNKGDAFIKSVFIPVNGEYTSRFVNNISKAFLSPIVRYTEIAELLSENAALNGVDFGVNASCLEIMIAAQARYAKDLSIPYRMHVNRSAAEGVSSDDVTELKFIKATEIPNVISTFTAFSFQNIGYAITTSARRHRKGLKNKQSNVEKTIKY